MRATYMANRASGVCGLKLLVYAALSYWCMRSEEQNRFVYLEADYVAPPHVTAAENPGEKRKKNVYVYLEADYVGPPHVTAAENPGTGVHLSIEP